jgi:hypothetical protein
MANAGRRAGPKPPHLGGHGAKGRGGPRGHSPSGPPTRRPGGYGALLRPRAPHRCRRPRRRAARRGRGARPPSRGPPISHRRDLSSRPRGPEPAAPHCGGPAPRRHPRRCLVFLQSGGDGSRRRARGRAPPATVGSRRGRSGGAGGGKGRFAAAARGWGSVGVREGVRGCAWRRAMRGGAFGGPGRGWGPGGRVGAEGVVAGRGAGGGGVSGGRSVVLGRRAPPPRGGRRLGWAAIREGGARRGAGMRRGRPVGGAWA